MKIAEVERFDRWVLQARLLEVVGRQAVPEAAATRMHLDVERVRAHVALQLDEVVAAAQRRQLRDTAFGPARSAPGRLP